MVGLSAKTEAVSVDIQSGSSARIVMVMSTLCCIASEVSTTGHGSAAGALQGRPVVFIGVVAMETMCVLENKEWYAVLVNDFNEVRRIIDGPVTFEMATVLMLRASETFHKSIRHISQMPNAVERVVSSSIER